MPEARLRSLAQIERDANQMWPGQPYDPVAQDYRVRNQMGLPARGVGANAMLEAIPGEEILPRAWEETGIPSFGRAGEAFGAGEMGMGALHSGLGALGVLGMAPGWGKATRPVREALEGAVKRVGGTPWYRGVSGDYPLRENSMWTTDPNQAGKYAQGAALTNTGEAANIIPARMPENMRGRNIDDEVMDALMEDLYPDDVAARIMRDENLGYVEFNHPNAGASGEHLVRMVRDPEAILSPIPTDYASRMARAREMGFHEQDFYHATNRDFAQFDPKFSDPGEDMGAAFFTSSPTVADEYLPGMFVKKGGGEGADRGGGVVRHYTEGSQIMPARIRNPEDFMIWDMRGNAFDIDFVKSQIGEAKKKGLPGVIFTEMPDPGMMSLGRPSSSHIVAVLDPSRIRSPHAMFDPAKRNSANILAGAGAAGLVGAGMAAQDRDPQNGMWF